MITHPALPDSFKIIVTHRRRWQYNSGAFVGMHLSKGLAIQEGVTQMATPYPKGGTTVALIVDKATNHVVATGRADCSDKDNYCRKIGRNIAVGRAVKAFDATVWPFADLD